MEINTKKHAFYRTGIPECFFGADSLKIIFDDNPQENHSKKFKMKPWVFDPYQNLLFYGKPGRGKSYAAIACMYFLEKRRIDWTDMAYVNIPELNQEWLANNSNYEHNKYRLDYLKEFKVLVLDDIGIRAPTPAFLDYLHVLIDERNNKKCITIYTTNLNSKEFNDFLGPRIASRISNGVQIEFNGPDMRNLNKK